MPSGSFHDRPDEVWYVEVGLAEGERESYYTRKRGRMYPKRGTARAYISQRRHYDKPAPMKLWRGTVTWEEVEP